MSTGAHETVLNDVRNWLLAGKRVWLCTITETWGSSPRPAGSWLAVSSDGDWSGSVSGGCLEEDLLNRCAAGGPDTPQLIDYGISDQDRDHFRLPCGGRIRLLVEPLFSQRDLPHVETVLEALQTRTPVARTVSLTSGQAGCEQADIRHSGVRVEEQVVRHGLIPEFRLLLVGAGEVARYVAEFAGAADFSVTLCEPRPTFSQGWGHADLPLVQALPDDLVSRSFNDPWAGVLALAHDPRVDDMALLAALNSSASYVGAMGSARTSAERRARLKSLGVTEEQLDRLKAPIGINIPSKTPAEIAISVVADLITSRQHLRVAHPSL
ncbi:XdhC family protein [Marinobacter sp. TBZ242]|uniref:XdhC family protein n=1 Tax=Marinobacter azerbaijanicus TaxID=3050455 RepID=A0ABT7IFI3_9GAMM|nr:XdhC family protein [Marinobacter sp. TBZ242]MDL0432507.1 XdhC family protein [Marinobacter sp. TBZ242]